MSALTEYRRPHPRTSAQAGGWVPAGGWEIAEGRWQRVWRRSGAFYLRRRGTRRAEVWRDAGAWRWRVLEWRPAAGVWKEIARDGNHKPYLVAQAAWPFADLAAGSGR